MELYPAIDIRGGRCVRLRQGDFSDETVYGADPVAVALGFEEAGARWMHVVDLDAALTGEPRNRSVVLAIAASCGVSVQAGGGVRTLADASELLDGGVARVVLGTAAADRPALIGEIASRWPGQVAVGVDHRNGGARIRGWMEGAGRPVGELLSVAAEGGASAVIVTDVRRDGLMSGPDLEGLEELLAATPVPLIASGGVASIDDIGALARLGASGRRLEGVIAGRAIYEGALDVAAAVELLAGAR